MYKRQVLDCATSITQRGKIEYFERLGLPTPEGMVVGNDGLPKTDSAQILKDFNTGEAALAPLGGIGEELAGYKGYGLSLIHIFPTRARPFQLYGM